QIERNLLRRFTGVLVPEDPPDDIRLGLIASPIAAQRLPVAAEPLHDIVAEGVATAGLAKRHAASKTSADLVRQVLEEQRIHGPLQADMQIDDRAPLSASSRRSANRPRATAPRCSWWSTGIGAIFPSLAIAAEHPHRRVGMTARTVQACDVAEDSFADSA